MILIFLLLLAYKNFTNENGYNLGKNSISIGKNTIVTGNNSIAIGKNNISTGNNESKESILEKFNSNLEKLEKIATKEKELSIEKKNLEDLTIKNSKILEAIVRIEEIGKSKNKAKKIYDDLVEDYNSYILESDNIIRDSEIKIEDFNSRISALSKIEILDIKSENDLQIAANKLKEKTEENTSLNLDISFYKDYIENYYKSYGELRKKELIYEKNDVGGYSDSSDEIYNIGFERKSPYVSVSSIKDLNSGLGNYYGGLNFYSNKVYKVDALKFNEEINFLNKPTKNIRIINYKVDIVDKEKYEDSILELEKYKATFKEYMARCNDPFLRGEYKEKLLTFMDKKFDYSILSYEAAYYQYEYEKTRNKSWIDKKIETIKKIENIKKEFENTIGILEYRRKEREKYKKEEIDVIREKNKLNIERLTNELEEALGINKNIILEIKNNKKNKENKINEAKIVYENINPSSSDLELSNEYERVKNLLNEKQNIISSLNEIISNLKNNLTLHNLENIGEKSISLGNDLISSGRNSLSIGNDSYSLNENSISIGNMNIVNSENSVSLGNNSSVNSKDSVSIGNYNLINGENNFVIGNLNKVGKIENLKNNNFILGNNIDASNVENAVVLGNNSFAISNALSIGSENNLRKIEFLASGNINYNSNQAINGSQIYSILNNPNNFNNIINLEKWSNLFNLNSKLNTDLSNIDLENINMNKTKEFARKISENTIIENGRDDELVNSKTLLEFLKLKKYNLNEEMKNRYLNFSDDFKITGNNKILSESDLSVELSDNLKNKLSILGNGTIDGDFDDLTITGNTLKKYISNGLSKKLTENTNIEKDEYNIANSKQIREYINKKINSIEILETNNKKINAGIANAIAMANSTNSYSNGIHNISISAGYFNKQGAGNVSYSMNKKRIGFKTSISLDSQLQFAIGMGLSYNFGSNDELERININNNADDEIKDLKNRINEKEDNINSLKNNLKDILKKYENIKNILNNLNIQGLGAIESYSLKGFASNIKELNEVQIIKLTDIVKKINKLYFEKNISTIDITGYADTDGEYKYNLNLGLSRAKNTLNKLIELGLNKNIKIGKISSTGFGNIIDGIDKSENRRVEIFVR